MAKIGVYYMNIGRIEEGLQAAFDRSVMLRPIRAEEWQQKANAYYSVVQFYAKDKKLNKAVEYADRGLKIIDEATKVNQRI